MPLPIYGSSQIELPRLGNISYENLLFEIRNSGGLNKALDKASEWALGKMKAGAEASAVQYSLDNPPNAAELHKLTTDYLSATPEQQQEKLQLLQQAVKGEVHPDNVRQGTVFAEAFEKSRIMQIKATLSALGQEEMAMYSQSVESGVDADGNPINISDVRNAINARINGLTSAMSQVDMRSANVLNGELISYADGIYRKAISSSSAAAIASESVKIDRYISNSGVMLSDMMRNIDGSGMINGVDANEAFNLMSDNIMANVIYMAQMNPELIKTSSHAAMKEMARIKVDSMASYFSSEEFAPNVLLAANRINKGDVGKMASVFSSIPTDEERSSIIKKVFEREASRIDMTNKMDAEKNRIKKDTFVSMYPSWLVEADPKKKDEIRSYLAENITSIDQAEKLFAPNDRMDNIDLRMKLFNTILRDRASGADLIINNAKNLSKDDISFLMNAYTSTEKSDYQLGISTLKNGAAVSDFLNLSDDQRKKNSIYFASLVRRYNDAIAAVPKNKPIDYETIAAGLLKNVAEPAGKPIAPQDPQASNEPAKQGGSSNPVVTSLLATINKELGGKVVVNEVVLSNRNAFSGIKSKLSRATLARIYNLYPALK